MKKIIGFIMAVIVAAALGGAPMEANAKEEAPAGAALAVSPRAFYNNSRKATVEFDGNSATFQVDFTVRDETSNSSGFYITGINSVSVDSFSGWKSVAVKDWSNGDVTYQDNHQTAKIPITYAARDKAGKASDLSTTLTITILK